MLFLALLLKKNSASRWLGLLLPITYLLITGTIKAQIKNSVIEHQHFLDKQVAANHLTLLPQPFSPFYWQAVIKDKNIIHYAYIKYDEDYLASIPVFLFNKSGYSEAFSNAGDHLWLQSSLSFRESNRDDSPHQAWQSDLMDSFRDFALYPVLLESVETQAESCHWFSDMRYHWPKFQPSFRYGICKNKQTQLERLYRKKYLSEEIIFVSESFEGREY